MSTAMIFLLLLIGCSEKQIAIDQIIGDSSESVHPVYVNDGTLQINTYILKRIK
jgi:hypothetical protein